ncbi:MAG: hypothetical protein RLZZ630_1803 [Bacteroidota bacterium]|jgi:hypothetical protein
MIRRYPIHALLLLVLLAGWILLSFYNVLVDDDLVFLRLLQEKGIAEATRYQYDTWNTRWMSFLWLHLWIGSFTPTGSLMPYHLFTLAALIAASYRSVRALQILNWVREGSAADTLFMATLMAFAIIISSYHIGDTWFWVNTSTMYGWNLIFILWACSIVSKPFPSPLLSSSCLALCGLYTGGSAEPAVACLLFILPVLLLINEISDDKRKHVLTFLIPMCISFLIAFIGKGHVKREEALPDADFLKWAGLSLWYSVRIVLVESPVRLLIVMALLWPLRSPTMEPVKLPEHAFRCSILFCITTIVIHAGLIVAIMGDYGPPRALSFIGLAAVICLLLLLHSFDLKRFARSGKVLAIAALLIASQVIFHQFKVLSIYQKHVKDIVSGKIEFRAEDVPDSGLLHRITFTE